MDDLAVEGDHGDLFGADPDGGGDVLVRVLFGDRQALAEEVESSVGTDVADHFNAALGRQACGYLVVPLQWAVEATRPHLVGTGPAVGRVAMVLVVEGHEAGILG